MRWNSKEKPGEIQKKNAVKFERKIKQNSNEKSSEMMWKSKEKLGEIVGWLLALRKDIQ